MVLLLCSSSLEEDGRDVRGLHVCFIFLEGVNEFILRAFEFSNFLFFTSFYSLLILPLCEVAKPMPLPVTLLKLLSSYPLSLSQCIPKLTGFSAGEQC